MAYENKVALDLTGMMPSATTVHDYTYKTVIATALPCSGKALRLWEAETESNTYHKLLLVELLNALAMAESYPTEFYRHVLPLVVEARTVLTTKGEPCPIDTASSNRAMQVLWQRVTRTGELKQIWDAGILLPGGTLQQGIVDRLSQNYKSDPLILKYGSGLRVALTGKHKLDIGVVQLGSERIACPFLIPKSQRNLVQRALSKGGIVEVTVVHKVATDVEFATLQYKVRRSVQLSQGVFLQDKYIPCILNKAGNRYTTEFHFKIKLKEPSSSSPVANTVHNANVQSKGHAGSQPHCTGRRFTGVHTYSLELLKGSDPSQSHNVITDAKELAQQTERREQAASRRKSALLYRGLTSGQIYELNNTKLAPRKKALIVNQLVKAAIRLTSSITNRAGLELQMDAILS